MYTDDIIDMFKPKYHIAVDNKFKDKYPVSYFSYNCYNKSDLKFLCDLLDSIPMSYQVNTINE